MLDKRVRDFGCSPNEICCGVTTSYIIGCLNLNVRHTRWGWGFANNPQLLLVLYATLQGLSIEGIGEGVSKNEMVTPMGISLFKTYHLSFYYYYYYFHTMIH
jgi:hypothetical protein